MLLNKKNLLVAGLSTLLVACGGSELDKKPAKVLYQEAVQHLYGQDAQYNFKADALVDIGIDNPFVSGLKINLSGAISNPDLRYELLPEVEAGMFSFKLPMLLDAKNKEILVNPGSVVETAMMFAPQISDSLQEYRNKFVRFSVNNFAMNEDELNQMMSVITELAEAGANAMQEVSQLIPEESIKKLALNDKAKELGAKAVLNVELNEQQSRELQQHVNGYFRDRLAANTQLPEELKQAFMEGLNEVQEDGGYESSASTLYLNDKGLPIHERAVYNYGFDGESVSISVNIDYSSHGKASFTIKPSASQILDFTEEHLNALQSM